jgi:hypothetical protein
MLKASSGQGSGGLLRAGGVHPVKQCRRRNIDCVLWHATGASRGHERRQSYRHHTGMRSRIVSDLLGELSKFFSHKGITQRLPSAAPKPVFLLRRAVSTRSLTRLSSLLGRKSTTSSGPSPCSPSGNFSGSLKFPPLGVAVSVELHDADAVSCFLHLGDIGVVHSHARR